MATKACHVCVILAICRSRFLYTCHVHDQQKHHMGKLRATEKPSTLFVIRHGREGPLGDALDGPGAGSRGHRRAERRRFVPGAGFWGCCHLRKHKRGMDQQDLEWQGREVNGTSRWTRNGRSHGLVLVVCAWAAPEGARPTFGLAAASSPAPRWGPASIPSNRRRLSKANGRLAVCFRRAGRARA